MHKLIAARRFLIAMVLSVVSLCVPVATLAQEVLLTINRDVNGVSDVVELSRAELEQLDQKTVRTMNDFVDAPTNFVGPLARDVLDTVGRGVQDTVLMTAANDFQVEIPVAEFDKYDVIFALSADGTTLSPRDKGPIWIIYPMSQHRELQDTTFNARLIWQLVRIDIK